MKKITCDVFNTGETIYFTIGRIAELEQLWGEPIFKAVQAGAMTFQQLITAFVVGMKHEGRKRDYIYYQEKLQQLFDEGEVQYLELVQLIVKALIGSGVFGKAAYYASFPEEADEKAQSDVEAEEAEAKTRRGYTAPSFNLWITKAERMAYGPLNLKPWEFMKLSPMEYYKLVEGYELRMEIEDRRQAYFTCIMTNVHIAGNKRLKVEDIMKQLHPMTLAQRKTEEKLFMEEFRQAGGEI